MRTRILITTLIIITCLSVKANDGAYRSRGSIIYPINETKISLENEILSFTVNERMAQVNVYFEFYNPEQTDRKILIGFQAPIPSGDAHPQFSGMNLISSFKVFKDGALIPYNIKAAGCENCELQDTSALKLSADGTYHGVFVYLFEVTFKPGKNIINHSYDFPASDNVTYGQIYRYILKTGSKWAGGSIKDFTLQIDMGKNSYFYVNDIFPKLADWTIVGTGKVTDLFFNAYNYPNRMIRILSGKLEVSCKDFRPTENLDFGVILGYSFINFLLDKSRVSEDVYRSIMWLTTNFKYKPITSWTKEDLLILRNAVYAQYGYQFKNKDLLKYFSQFEWYIPDPNLTLDKIVLTDKEKKFIDEIVEKSK